MLVSITGNAWDHQGQPIPAFRHPELWFEPQASTVSHQGALLARVEAKATLNSATGAFTVDLESEPNIFYRPVMTWFRDTTSPDPEMWSRGRLEWPFLVAPGDGGRIDELINEFPPGAIIAALAPPPDSIEAVIWIDMTDVTPDGAMLYGPEGWHL